MSAAGSDLQGLSGQPVNIVHGTRGQLIAFLVLNVWPSHFGLPLLLSVVIFSKRIRRHATFINFCVAFLIIGISSSLLLYAGKIEGPEPSKMLCLLQASLLEGMPPFTSMSALMLVLQMFLTVRAQQYGQEYLDKDHKLRVMGMLVSPYIAYITTILTTAAIGASRPERVSRGRRFFYCSLDYDPLSNAATIFAAIILLITVVLEVCTGIILIKLWKIFKQDAITSKLKFFVRILLYGIYLVFAMSLSLLSIKAPHSPAPDLMIATAASVVVLIFGTQSDILRAMLFWRRRPPEEVKTWQSTTTSNLDIAKEWPARENKAS